MNKNFLLVAFLGLALTHCSPGPEFPIVSTDPAANANWKLGIVTFKQVLGFRTDDGPSATTIAGTDGITSSTVLNVNSWSFQFTKLPSVDGSYKIHPIDVSTPLLADEVIVTASLPSLSKVYIATGKDATAVSIKVTISGGKISIEVPEIIVQEVTDKTTIKLNGLLVEN
jgi:hypothetical protein